MRHLFSDHVNYSSRGFPSMQTPLYSPTVLLLPEMAQGQSPGWPRPLELRTTQPNIVTFADGRLLHITPFLSEWWILRQRCIMQSKEDAKYIIHPSQGYRRPPKPLQMPAGKIADCQGFCLTLCWSSLL